LSSVEGGAIEGGNAVVRTSGSTIEYMLRLLINFLRILIFGFLHSLCIVPSATLDPMALMQLEFDESLSTIMSQMNERFRKMQIENDVKSDIHIGLLRQHSLELEDLASRVKILELQSDYCNGCVLVPK